MMPDRLEIKPDLFAQDIHAQKGLACVACHGGDAAQEDADRSMSRAAGFRGKIPRAQIPALCASCHSNAAYMRSFNPSLRTDQFSQYQTSGHGRRLARGDTRVAVCIDCHSVHGIRPASHSRSTVHPLRVAETCAACHSSAEHMKGYAMPVEPSKPMPTDQFAGYSASVHHEALAARGDLSAPTCSTCHGNHGAAPPGVASVERVCATCHVFQAQLFDGGPHKAAFEALGLPSCVTCHSNHRISHPSDAMIGTGKDAVCLTCHSLGDAGYQGAEKMRAGLDQLAGAIRAADEMMARAEHSGMEISEAKLEQSQARDALTRARVTIHAFQPDLLAKDVQAGVKVAEKNLQAGVTALTERDFRRLGLGVSLVTILVVLIGLRLYIRKIESGDGKM